MAPQHARRQAQTVESSVRGAALARRQRRLRRPRRNAGVGTRFRQQRVAIALDLPTTGFRLGGRNDDWTLLGSQTQPIVMPEKGDLCITPKAPQQSRG